MIWSKLKYLLLMTHSILGKSQSEIKSLKCWLTFSLQQRVPYVQLPQSSEARAVVLRRNHCFLFLCSHTDNQEQQEGNIHSETHQTADSRPRHHVLQRVMSTDGEIQSWVHWGCCSSRPSLSLLLFLFFCWTLKTLGLHCLLLIPYTHTHFLLLSLSTL